MALLRISLLLFGGIYGVLSDFTHLKLDCTTENNKHLENCSTDSCTWSVDLKYCDTLVIQCTGPDQKERECRSLKECGISAHTNIIRNVTGEIHCDLKKDQIECFSRILYEDKKYLHHCNSEYCGLQSHTVPGSNPEDSCKFAHDLVKCVQENKEFPIEGGLNCTTTPVIDPGKQDRRTGCDDKKDLSDPNKCDTEFKRATIGLGVLCPILLIAIIAMIAIFLKRGNKGVEEHKVTAEGSPEENIKLKSQGGNSHGEADEEQQGSR